jgi:hypothetical protein
MTNEIEYHYTYFNDKNWLCIGNARRFKKGIFKQVQTHGDIDKVIASEIGRLGLTISNKKAVEAYITKTVTNKTLAIA